MCWCVGIFCVSVTACAFMPTRPHVRVFLQRCFVDVEWPFKPLNSTVKKQAGIEGLISSEHKRTILVPTQEGRFKAIRIALPTYCFWCQRVGEWESQLLPVTERGGCHFSWIPLDTINVILHSEVYLILMRAGPRLWAYKWIKWWCKEN